MSIRHRRSVLWLVFVLASTVWTSSRPTAQAPASEAQALLDRFKSASTDAERRAAAIDIAQNDLAKLRLKQKGYEALGGRYYDAMKGTNGVMQDVVEQAKVRLKALNKWDPALIDKVQLIENEASRFARKAPMDQDVGLLAGGGDAELKALGNQIRTKDLRGNRAILEFHTDLQRELEAAMRDVGGAAVNPGKMSILGTTPFHAEAYAASEVLAEGGVARVSLMQQTGDVGKYKINELRNRFIEALQTGSEADQAVALVEAARQTVKEARKLDAAIAEIELATSGTKPTPEWIAAKNDLIDSLDRLWKDPGIIDNPTLAIDLAGKAAGGPAALFDRCTKLIDGMESAFRALSPADLLKVKLYQKYLSPEVRQKAALAIVNGDPLPPEARALDEQLAKAMAAREMSVRPDSPREFLARLKANEKWADLKFDPSDENVTAILQRVDTLSPAELEQLVGAQAAESVVNVRTLLEPGARQKLYLRLLKEGALEGVEKNTLTLLREAERTGGSGAAGHAFLGGVVLMQVAQAFSETAGILDRNLSPEVESRAVTEAWVRAMPLVGEIYGGVIEGSHAWARGDKAALGEAALSIAVGVSWVVPPLQVPVMVVTLGIVAVKASWSMAEVGLNRELITAWVESGDWDLEKGELRGLLTASGKVSVVPPDPRFMDDLYVQGDIQYHTGFSRDPEKFRPTIRASLIDYVERLGLKDDKGVQAAMAALKKLYPTFDVAANLREPAKVGRVALVKLIVEHHGDPRKDLALSTYVTLEDAYAQAVENVAPLLKKAAEQEFQAEHMVGEAKRTFDDLTALSVRLRPAVPLLTRVQTIETSFMSLAATTIKTPWEEHGVKARVVDHVAQYLNGYRRVEGDINQIRQILTRTGVTPPTEFNLTGFLTIDAPRINGLVGAYTSAVGDAARDAADAAAKAGVAFDPTSTCGKALAVQLAKLKAGMVLARDWELLALGWSGRTRAAAQSRDQALQRAQNFAERRTPVPLEVWRALSAAFEDAYALTTAGSTPWAGSDFTRLAENSRATLSDLERQYIEAQIAGRAQFAAGCQSPQPKPTAAGPPAGPVQSGDACVKEWQATLDRGRASFDDWKTHPRSSTGPFIGMNPSLGQAYPYIPTELWLPVAKELPASMEPLPGCSSSLFGKVFFGGVRDWDAAVAYNRCAWPVYLQALERAVNAGIAKCPK